MNGEKHIPEQSSPPGGYTQTAIPVRLSWYLHHYEMHHHLLPYKLLRGEGEKNKKT